MIKPNKRKVKKVSKYKNPKMPARGKVEEKFGLELDAIAEHIRKKHSDYVYEYELWLSSEQEKKLKLIMKKLYELAAELS